MERSIHPGSEHPEDAVPLTLGIDLGGTKVLSALVDREGRVVASHRQATHPARGFEAIAADIAACALRCLEAGESSQVIAAGVGVAGQVQRGTGVVRYAPNLGWTDAPLGAVLAESLQLPVLVLNDVRAAAWGEWHCGAGAGLENLAVVFVGTGVGGALVSGGRMLEGCGNAAGELGHMTVVAGGRPCRCGNRGCLEAYVGGWAIAERAKEAMTQRPMAGSRLAAVAAAGHALTAADVTEAAREGDPLATALVDETMEYLAAGLTGIVNAFNPCALVVGGGVIEHAPEYLQAASPRVLQRVLPSAAEHLRIVPAGLGDQAGAIGAGTAAFAQFGEHPRVGADSPLDRRS